MYCKFVQWRLVFHMENGTQPGVFLRRHMQTCPHCRGQFQIFQLIDQQLQSQNPDLPTFDKDLLHKKIMTNLPGRHNSIYAPTQKTWRVSMIPAVGLAAVLLITAVLLWFHQRPLPAPSPKDLSRFNQLTIMNLDPLHSGLIERSMQQSLEKELNQLKQDAQKAVHFFAACLPDAEMITHK